MDIGLLAVGRLKAGPERELCDRYLKRARKAGGPLGFRAFTMKEVAESRATRGDVRMAQEADTLVALAPRGGRIVCLDEAGDLVGSEEFARVLGRDVDAAIPHTIFVIGGPDGLGEKVSRLADRRISFGRMTWPHQFVRILLAEQLYRAMAILSGHPYHRA
jgi:23S rRNA (pseudouridine1915-N3)-methyltransferase